MERPVEGLRSTCTTSSVREGARLSWEEEVESGGAKRDRRRPRDDRKPLDRLAWVIVVAIVASQLGQ